MQERIKVLFHTPGDANNFVSICQQYKEDINLYYGHQVIDAKSCMGVIACGCGSIFEVEILTDDFMHRVNFLQSLEKFKYRSE